jgi:hypothetical protein
MSLDALSGGVRRSLSPDLVDQVIGRDRFTCVDQKDGQNGTSLSPPQRDRFAIGNHLHRAK